MLELEAQRLAKAPRQLDVLVDELPVDQVLEALIDDARHPRDIGVLDLQTEDEALVAVAEGHLGPG